MDKKSPGILSELISKIINSKAWNWLLMNILPYVRFSMYYTRYKGVNYIVASRIMSPGQFILCLDEQKGTAFLVPGFMTHACYVVNNCMYSGNSEYEIAEMTHHNYSKSYLFDVCKESSRILICDCMDWDLEHKKKMIEAIKRFYDAKYDVQFKFGIKSLYCSELVYQLDRIATHPEMTDAEFVTSNVKGLMDLDISDFAGLGQEYISPDGLLFGKNTRVVWDSDGELTGLMGPEAEKYCKQKGYIK